MHVMSVTSEMRFARTFDRRVQLFGVVRDVYCVSLSSVMQFTALALVKDCGLVSTAFSAHEFANQCYFVSFVCFSCTPPVRGRWLLPRQLSETASRRCSLRRN